VQDTYPKYKVFLALTCNSALFNHVIALYIIGITKYSVLRGEYLGLYVFTQLHDRNLGSPIEISTVASIRTTAEGQRIIDSGTDHSRCGKEQPDKCNLSHAATHVTVGFEGLLGVCQRYLTEFDPDNTVLPIATLLICAHWNFERLAQSQHLARMTCLQVVVPAGRWNIHAGDVPFAVVKCWSPLEGLLSL